mgnify:CR=1 FL=1
MTSSNKVKGFAAGIVAAVCYGTNPLGTLELYGDGFNSSSVLIYRDLLAVLMFAMVMPRPTLVVPETAPLKRLD